MILYKYMSDSAAKSVLSNGSIGFANPDTFNDPFELHTGYPPEGDNPIDLMLDEIRSNGKRYIWSNNTGILCLTRNPLNPLMWAHYGDEHRGVVLGFDANTAGFLDDRSCLIPAQHGNVIYTHTRPIHPLISFTKGDPLNIGHTFHYPSAHQEKLQRLFLQKPACWSYEEEVRVVKCIAERDENGTNQSGSFTELTLPSKTLYCYQLPKGSIKEVYFGMRHKGVNSAGTVQEYKELQPDISIKGSRLSKNTWDIEVFDFQ